MMNKNLDRIEAQLRSLFENNLFHLLTGNHNTSALIDDLIQVMDQNLLEKPDGRTFAPDSFQLIVPPDDLLEWQAHQDVLDEIAETIYSLGLKNGFYFQSTPKVTLHASEAVAEHDVQIEAEFTPIKPVISDTAAVESPQKTVNGASVPKNAFLVVRGRENFPLEKTVINIGRHSDNDLVIDDKYVSRHHAQLRAINQHFVIFDLGSTGGILLNGKPISQATLQAGDVLRIGEVNLIYIQDSTSAHPTTAMPVNTGGEDIE
jgi:pSer/pThr/pTyr-binding forkhead associated (FHA) protein